MKTCFGVFSVSLWSLLFAAGAVFARPQKHEFTPIEDHVDMVGDVGAPAGKVAAGRRPAGASQDTCWIADWTFEGACGPTQPGWERVDLRITNMGGVHYWQVNSNYDVQPLISGNAASLTKHDLCWVFPDGYDNDWYMGICLTYSGATTITWDYALDSEADFDFLLVETDSSCASFGLVDYSVAPGKVSRAFRETVWSASGLVPTTHHGPLTLTNYGAGTHCVYIAFFADAFRSHADAGVVSTLGAGAVVDNIVLAGDTNVTEDFDGAPVATFRNMGDGVPFGQWARTFPHVTDNAICTENESCAWLHTDDMTPTMATTPAMSFGPGGFVVRSWIDEAVISPWVNLTLTPGAAGTVLSFRRFPGNFFNQGKILQNWAVRGFKRIANSDTPSANDSIDCVSLWGRAGLWNQLSLFNWITSIFNMEIHFDPTSTKIQVRFRAGDWQHVAGSGPPTPSYNPGPGPYSDRVRIGRRIVSGPVFNEGIDARHQAQDAFPATVSAGLPNTYTQIPPGTNDIFRTVPWSMSNEVGSRNSANVLVGDSITCNVLDVTGNAVVPPVRLYGRIVQGPHTGKAPPPFAAGASGFFVVDADSAAVSGVPVAGRWFVDIDDEYLLPGDELRYFWYATDMSGVASSLPEGLESDPTSVTLEQAEAETGGLFEVKALPSVIWDEDLLNAIAASPAGGKVDPYDAAHPEWRDDPLNNGQPGRQQNCILYYEIVNVRRRSGDPNRTSFMYTLDELGYRGSYDVYDQMGLGSTNNQLGSRCTTSQCRTYSLLVFDAGNREPGWPILPDGSNREFEKVNMLAWFTGWLEASTSLPVSHTFWLLGSNVVEEKRTASLINNYMGVGYGGAVTVNVNPDVLGTAGFAFVSGPQTFVGDTWTLNGGCWTPPTTLSTIPTVRNYDNLTLVGGTATHQYGSNGVGSGENAIVMNKDAAADWNTIMQSHPWFDIRDPDSPAVPASEPESDFMLKVLQAALPIPCQEPLDPTDTAADVAADLPRAYRLAQNVPNPFNPVTTIQFELPRAGPTSLEIYDSAGRLVRRLVEGPMDAGRHSRAWNGLDEAGKRVSTGVYFYRLASGAFRATHKMILIQ